VRVAVPHRTGGKLSGHVRLPWPEARRRVVLMVFAWTWSGRATATRGMVMFVPLVRQPQTKPNEAE